MVLLLSKRLDSERAIEYMLPSLRAVGKTFQVMLARFTVNDDVSAFRAMGGQAKLTRTGDVTDNLDLPTWRSLTPSKNPRVKSHRVAICQATVILFS